MQYLLKYNRYATALFPSNVIFIALTLKSIFCCVQRIIYYLHSYLSLQRAKLTGSLFWTEEEIANCTTTVTSLFVYHVKSIRPVVCQQITIDSRGFAGDRRYMLVTKRNVPLCGTFQPGEATHRFLTQCHYPSLSKVVSDIVMSEIDPHVKLLRFSVDGEERTLTIAMNPDQKAQVYRSTLWDDIVNVQDMGDMAATYFQSIFADDKMTSETIKSSKSVRLVVQRDSHDRFANERFIPSSLRSIFRCNPRMHLGSAYPVLIASEASLEDLNRRLNGKGIDSIPISRFRPNIVIKGITPFAEDRMKVIQIGGTIFHIVACCPRCKQTCIDDTTGNRTSEPLKTMLEFRERDSNNVYFAVHAIPAWNSIGNEIRIGDAVKVLQWGDPIWGDL